MPIQTEDELHGLNQLALQDFSYSRINTYQQCELQYFYSYVLKEPQDFGHAAKLGNIIHQALEVTLEHGEKISLADLLENYQLAKQDYDPNSEISDTMIEEGAEMLRDFVVDNPEEVDVYAKEMPFSFVLGRARFNGFIDYVSVHDTYVRIRDYKSGRKEVPYKDVPTNLQLGIYALWLKRLFPDKEIHAELYYMRTGKARGHRFTDDDLQAVENRLIEIVETILDKENFVATTNERNCWWCSYGKNGVCPTGKLRLDGRSPRSY